MKKWVLLGVIIIAFVLRTFSLDKLPSGFTPDEASFGYDAYSILKTGADQWGHKLPLVLESFGDYKSPLYAYLTIPFVAIIGLTETAVRLPNAILGTFAVLVVYLLTSKLFNKKAGLVTALLFAVSPWHIMLSRGAFEANLTTFFLPFAIWLLLEKKYIWAGLVLGLNLFTYHTAKFVTPIVVLMFIIFYKNELIASLRKKNVSLILGTLIFAFLSIVMFYTFFLGAGARVSERVITQGASEAAFPDRVSTAKITGDFVARLVHNKYQIVVKRFVENYFSYFSPQFLFISGPKEATYGMIPGAGVLLWVCLPFLIFARRIFYLSRDEKDYKKAIVFLGLWILVSPIPASLASGVGFSANRVAAMMPAVDILIGIGAYSFFEFVKNKKFIITTSILVVILFFGLFVVDYFIESPIKTSQAMLYGNLEAARYVKENFGSSKKIIVDKSVSEPHIYFAFANRTDPSVYQKNSANWKYKDMGVSWVDQMSEYSLDNITFKDIEGNDLKDGNVLVGKPDDFKFEVNPEKIIYYPSGEKAIEIIRI